MLKETIKPERELISRELETETDEHITGARESRDPLPIGDNEIKEAVRLLREYKNGKQALDNHIVEDERWWELRHWEQLNREDGEPDAETRGEIDPKSAWAFNAVTNKHADFMDAAPGVTVLPRGLEDERGAEMLTAILPVICERNNFEEIYSSVVYDKVIHGTGCYGAFWDGSADGGRGEVKICDVDVLSLFWEPGVKDIQESANLFFVQKLERREAELRYPEMKENLSAGTSGIVEEYDTTDYVDEHRKVELVDWYYKRGGVLHLCQFIGGTVVFSSENQPESFPEGIYRHGKYPFFIDRLYPIKRSPAGFGIIDIAKSDQEVIDRLSREVVNDALYNTQKTFMNESAGVNEEDLNDPKVRIVRFHGSLDEKNFRAVQPQSNAASLMNVVSSKIAQLKETAGNNDAASGAIPAGVTAASAIAALQEQSGKTSRDAIKASYRVHAELMRCVVELVQEFYTLPRTYRIIGEGGAVEYKEFSNSDLHKQTVKTPSGDVLTLDPVFDISVCAQKASAYSSLAQNELAIQFYNAGFFNPQNADAALLAIELMDFKDKQKIITKISKNKTLYDMLKELSARLAEAEAALGAVRGGLSTGSAPEGKAPAAGKAEAPSLEKEPKHVEAARVRARESAVPR